MNKRLRESFYGKTKKKNVKVNEIYHDCFINAFNSILNFFNYNNLNFEQCEYLRNLKNGADQLKFLLNYPQIKIKKRIFRFKKLQDAVDEFKNIPCMILLPTHGFASFNGKLYDTAPQFFNVFREKVVKLSIIVFDN